MWRSVRGDNKRERSTGRVGEESASGGPQRDLLLRRGLFLMGAVIRRWMPWLVTTIVSIGAVYYAKESAEEARLAREDAKPALHVSLMTEAPYFTRDGEKVDIEKSISEFAISVLGSRLAPRMYAMDLLSQQ